MLIQRGLGVLLVLFGAAVLFALSIGLLATDQISFKLALLLGIPGVVCGALGAILLMVEGELLTHVSVRERGRDHHHRLV